MRGIPIVVAVMMNHTMSSVGEAETVREKKSDSIKKKKPVYYITVDNDTLRNIKVCQPFKRKAAFSTMEQDSKRNYRK